MSEKLREAYWNNEGNHEWWERPAKEVLDLIRSESPENGREALDLGCGLGRHALALAVAGFHVAATDRSSHLCLREISNPGGHSLLPRRRRP